MSRDWSKEYLDEECCRDMYIGKLEKRLSIAIKGLETIATSNNNSIKCNRTIYSLKGYAVHIIDKVNKVDNIK